MVTPIALFGYRGIGQRHLVGLQALLGESMDQHLVIAGRNTEEAMNKTKQFGNFEIFADYRELLTKVRPKLVIVATPNFLHKEMTIATLKAGAHVLCEKPLGVSQAEVRQMFDVARECDRLLIPAMSLQYSPTAIWLREKMNQIDEWQIFAGQARYVRGQHIPGSIGFLKKEQAGGGVLLDLGTHMIDLLLTFIGNKDKMVAVKATTQVDPQELTEEARTCNDYGSQIDLSQMDVEYAVDAELYFAGGGSVKLAFSWASSSAEAVRGKLADEVAPFIQLASQDGKILRWSIYHSLLSTGNAVEQISEDEERNERYIRQIEQVADMLAGQAKPPVSAEEAIKVHQIIDAIYASAAQSGKRVEL